MAQDGDEMKQLLRRVLHEESFAEELAANGLATIKQRHTCAHRVDELLGIYAQFGLAQRIHEGVATEGHPYKNATRIY